MVVCTFEGEMFAQMWLFAHLCFLHVSRLHKSVAHQLHSGPVYCAKFNACSRDLNTRLLLAIFMNLSYNTHLVSWLLLSTSSPVLRDFPTSWHSLMSLSTQLARYILSVLMSPAAGGEVGRSPSLSVLLHR